MVIKNPFASLFFVKITKPRKSAKTRTRIKAYIKISLAAKKGGRSVLFVPSPLYTNRVFFVFVSHYPIIIMFK